jgi:hypothetical protein
MNLPTGCKDVKLNLTNAYRTTFSHIQAGDVLRVEWNPTGNGMMIPTATHSPKRSFWVEIMEVSREGRHICLHTRNGAVITNSPHTAITRKERQSEHEEALRQMAAEREEALAESRAELAAKSEADHAEALEMNAQLSAVQFAANTSMSQREDTTVRTAECPRCEWSITRVMDEEAVTAQTAIHIHTVHQDDMEAEQEELRQLRMVAIKYAQLVDAITKAHITAKQSHAQQVKEGREPLSPTAATELRVTSFFVQEASMIARISR